MAMPYTEQYHRNLYKRREASFLAVFEAPCRHCMSSASTHGQAFTFSDANSSLRNTGTRYKRHYIGVECRRQSVACASNVRRARPKFVVHVQCSSCTHEERIALQFIHPIWPVTRRGEFEHRWARASKPVLGRSAPVTNSNIVQAVDDQHTLQISLDGACEPPSPPETALSAREVV